LIESQVPISFIVLTFNEEKNLNSCLGSVAGWAKEIFVVDSGSADHTLEIAGRHGAQCFYHPFDTHAKQWRWALDNLPISTDWILALDADQSVTAELRKEIGNFLQGRNDARGCYVRP
jgi:glycosyltransferase involved in cell wall biosynthesis